jgi:tetratricopeptide (TPR) repeat protein
MAKAPEQWQIPATAQAILAARIDRLPPEDKRLLQAASIIGKDVPFALLQAIAEVSEDSLHLGLTHLQGAEFLYEASLFPDLEYTFKHALTHEVAYGSVLQERRRTLHAQIVEAIERLYPDRLSEHVERLVHHAIRAEQWEKALPYCRQAGAKAFVRSTHRDAIGYFEQALVALGHLPDDQERREQAIDLRLEMRNALIVLGEFGAMFESLRIAETLAQSLEDSRRLGWVLAYMSPYFQNTGDQDRAVETGQRALAIAVARRDFALEVMATFFLGLPHMALGDYRRAVYYHRRNVEALTGQWLHERFGEFGLPSVFARAYLCWSLAELGESAEGLARAEEAVEIAETVDQPFTLSHAYFGLGMLRLRRGDLRQAIAALERSLAICQVSDIKLVLPWAASALGYAYALGGRSAESLPLLEQAVEQSASFGGQQYYPLWVTHLGEAYLLADRLDDARQMAERALTFARGLKQRGHEAYALRLRGEIARRLTPLEVEPAVTAYQHAIALAKELEMRPLAAHCHLGLGKLYHRAGDRAKAQEHLTTAATMYREMDMGFWLEKAKAELGLPHRNSP